MPLSAASRKRLDRTAIYVVSAGAHVLFFVILGLGSPELRRTFIDDRVPPVEAFIMPPPPRETPARKIREPSPPPSPIRPRQAVIRPQEPLPVPPLPLAPVPSPKPPPPTPPASAGGGGTGANPDPWAVAPGGELRDALRRSPVGCANEAAVGLNRREREACAEKLGKGAADAPYIPPAIGRAKQDAYDATAARKEASRRRKELPAPTGINPADSPLGPK